MGYYTISKRDLKELNFKLENYNNALKSAFSHFMLVLMSKFPNDASLSIIKSFSLDDNVQLDWSSADSALTVMKKFSRYGFRIKKDSIYLGDFDFVDATVAFELLKNSEKVEAYLEKVKNTIKKDSEVLVKATKAATDTKDIFTSCIERFKELYHNTGKTLESVIGILKDEGYANNVILATVVTVLKDAEWND
jgi:hypothetical protein